MVRGLRSGTESTDPDDKGYLTHPLLPFPFPLSFSCKSAPGRNGSGERAMIYRGRNKALPSRAWLTSSLAAGAPSLAVLTFGTAYAEDATWQGPGNQWTTGAN